jgi:hypothetical protein
MPPTITRLRTDLAPVLLAGASLLLAGCAGTERALSERPGAGAQVRAATELQWGPLNPARGDASPRAANLWGDRASTGATGFLVRFADGFASPPHIHNVTYRGVVIQGQVHNDDPDAAPMWMPTGSYWTQPAGEPHVTAAQGESVAYIEIGRGPYLVRPTDQAFDNGERPINIHRSNLVWMDAPDQSWVNVEAEAPTPGEARVAALWTADSPVPVRGALIELSRGFSGSLGDPGSTIHAVVIEGSAVVRVRPGATEVVVSPGDSLTSEGAPLRIASLPNEHALLFIRSTAHPDSASRDR